MIDTLQYLLFESKEIRNFSKLHILFINLDFQKPNPIIIIIINYSPVKCASCFPTLEQHDDQDRIVTVIIVQVPDTFAQEALASTPPFTRRASTKILYPLYFWTLSNECKIFLTPRERSN